MASLNKVQSDADLWQFIYSAAENGIQHLDFQYLRKSDVYQLLDDNANLCGGFVINHFIPERTFDPKMLGKEVVENIKHYTRKYYPMEITAVWLKRAYRGRKEGIKLWWLLAKVATAYPKKWMVFGTIKESLAKYYKIGPGIQLVYKGPSLLYPDKNCYVYLMPIVSLYFCAIFSPVLKIFWKTLQRLRGKANDKKQATLAKKGVIPRS